MLAVNLIFSPCYLISVTLQVWLANLCVVVVSEGVALRT